MDQITSINNAISAQANRVDAIRRSLMPLPGKLHQIDATTMTKTSLRKRITPAAKALLTGQIAAPDLIRNTANVVAPIVRYTSKIAEVAERDSLDSNLDGITAGILGPEYLSDEDVAVAVSYSIETSIVETGLLSQDVTFINSDIIDLLLVAASSPTLKPEAIHAEDLIAPSGFCYLEKPIIVGDYHPETGEYSDDIKFGWRAFSWQTTANGLNFMIYTDWGIYRHIYAPSAEDHDPNIHDSLVKHAAWRDDDIFVADIQRWNFGKVWGTDRDETMSAQDQLNRIADAFRDEKTPLLVNPHVELFRKFVLSMMRFSHQKLLVSERATVTRQVRRAAVRELGKDFTMNILRLRRIKKASSDGETGEGHRLDHRIVARGHWKNHYYRSWGPCYLEDGTPNPDSHRRIWVDPYVKGPEDAPFVHKHKINALVR
jgi:hypothetical protein